MELPLKYYGKRYGTFLIIMFIFTMIYLVAVLLLSLEDFQHGIPAVFESLTASPLFQLNSSSNAPVPLVCHDTSKLCPSSRDKRQYEYFVLAKNRLRVVAISDEKVAFSAVALSVNTGTFNDPPSHQGLAHLCEHMLFLGTAKYPDAKTYSSFIFSHGGALNAHTKGQETKFHFRILPDYLEQALDIFAQFFISPLVNEELLSREINAVHEEHRENMQSEKRGEEQLLKHIANPHHPFHQFDTGNKDTLNKTDLRNQVLNFLASRYSSNTVSLNN